MLALDVRLDATGIPRLATHGWQQTSTALWNAIERFMNVGLTHVLCTDIARDGTLTGPNCEAVAGAGAPQRLHAIADPTAARAGRPGAVSGRAAAAPAANRDRGGGGASSARPHARSAGDPPQVEARAHRGHRVAEPASERSMSGAVPRPDPRDGSRPPRVMLGAVGWAGHAFPVLALARDLRRQGHEVLVETFERWRGAVEEIGAGFAPADEQMVFGGLRDAPGGPTLAEAARSLVPTMTEFDPDIVVSDLFTLTPALAAESAGIPRATLIPHPYPVVPPGLPFFTWGLRPPRSPLGAAGWRATRRVTDRWLEGGRRDLNQARAELGLAPIERFFGAISDGLALVATFPQLEYPRRWPAHVHVTGPMLFELRPP